jgi:hypothetical protein
MLGIARGAHFTQDGGGLLPDQSVFIVQRLHHSPDRFRLRTDGPHGRERLFTMLRIPVLESFVKSFPCAGREAYPGWGIAGLILRRGRSGLS